MKFHALPATRSLGLESDASPGGGRALGLDLLARARSRSSPVLRGCALALLAAPALAQAPFSPQLLIANPSGSDLAGLEVADFDGDGRDDIVTSGAGSGQVFLARGQGTFAAPTSFPLPNSTITRTDRGDFDGDGDVDLVVGNRAAAAPSIELFLNDGTGGFSSSATVALGAGVYTVTAADLDGDGKLDVIAPRSSGALELFVVRGNGAGGFLPPASFALTARGSGVAVGDVNADGDADVVLARLNGGATLMIGNGAGGFSAVQEYSHNQSSNVVALRDVDGDLDLDLIVDRFSSSQIEVRLNDGLGVFSAPTQSNGTQLLELHTPDLDGDASPDLVGVGYYGDVAVWRNLGGGAFEPVRIFGSVAESASASGCGDLDGDGRVDLAVSDVLPNSIAIMPGDGACNLGHQRLVLPQRPFSPAVADLNSDGRDDLVTGSRDSTEAFVSLQQAGGGFATSTLALSATPLWVSFGDVNNDGRADMVTGHLTAVEVRRGNGTGGFGLPVTTPMTQTPQRGELGDVNGDGFDDLVWKYWVFPSGTHVRASLSDGTGGFTAILNFNALIGTPAQVYDLATGHFNQDNAEDILLATENACLVILTAGGGTFTTTTLWSGFAILTARVGDLDGDGNLDVVAARAFGGPQVRLIFGDGAGNFPTGTTINLDAQAKSLEIGDFDDDGDADVLAMDMRGVVHLILGDGVGGFSLLAAQFPGQVYSDVNNYSGMGLCAIDADGDGRTDVALTDERLPLIRFLKQNSPSEHPDAYCTAKTTSNGCVPSIATIGVPSASPASGFFVTCSNVINQKNGLFFYSLNGRAHVPFQGGTLCVVSPVARTPLGNSGGNTGPDDCSGVFSIDMNAFAQGTLGGSPQPALSIAGTVVTGQWWGRDPATSPATMLSNAIEYLVGP